MVRSVPANWNRRVFRRRCAGDGCTGRGPTRRATHSSLSARTLCSHHRSHEGDPASHLADTLAASDGLCDASVAQQITRSAPAAIETLLRYGVRFDHDSRGALLLGLESAHSRRRIVDATGDGTGKEIMRALAAAVRNTASVTVLEGFEAHRLLVDQDTVSGLGVTWASDTAVLPANRVVLATGGLGGLFCHATNPRGAFGQRLTLAARAGAVLIDMEFVQFHPTAHNISVYPFVLVSEAVRGEGAVLIDETGSRFMADIPGQELARRDVVARAIWHHRRKAIACFWIREPRSATLSPENFRSLPLPARRTASIL
jgi:L-aspartate oxidase